MLNIRSLQRYVVRCVLPGVVLGLILVATSPPLAYAQQPPATARRNQSAPGVWQTVPFDTQMFLRLQPGWYRLQDSMIYFVIYPDMASMARGLDRAAYFIEKAATKGVIVPRDRIQGNAFYGHDYSLKDLAHFFNTLRRQRSRHDMFREERRLQEQ